MSATAFSKVSSESQTVHVFPIFEMLDAKIASALKRIITNQYFRRIKEQHAQKIRQISSRKTDGLCDPRTLSSYS